MEQKSVSDIIKEIKADVADNMMTLNHSNLDINKQLQNNFIAMAGLIREAIAINDKELLASLPFKDPEIAISCLTEFSKVWEASKVAIPDK